MLEEKVVIANLFDHLRLYVFMTNLIISCQTCGYRKLADVEEIREVILQSQLDLVSFINKNAASTSLLTEILSTFS